MSKKLLTIAQILALPEGEWANGDIFAVLTNPKPPRGKGPWTATLTDSTGSIVGKFWGGGIDHWSGKRVKLSGAGMQRKSYQNVPELSVGQKADVSFAGAPGTAAQEDEIPGMEATQTVPARVTSPRAVQTSPARPNAPTASGTPVNGQTVGMAVKLAGDLLLSENKDFIAEANWAARLRAAACQIIAVSRSLEMGTPFEGVNEEPPPF